ncbi:hypothetical protein Ami103574_10910 [Aminipila butyrica]|uniref:SAF domain-containing protein n=1 Tax=Aminipila butyrica TaxID=433296 RepID=A0A858BX98_9FIRM|nr:SAF domain-containing protein [Aminipila butyrica]QIB69799.1 hypothetical protein Ami103574_10910 [Aminipila butyrica]
MNKGKKIMMAVAVILIITGTALLLIWELWGNEYVNYKIVVVAADKIEEGDVISEKDLKTEKFLKRNVLKNTIRPDEIEKYIGMTARQNIVKESQVDKSYLVKADKYIKPGESVYKIPADWIGMCSSSVRKDDTVEVYGSDGASLGTFKVAFVKDVQEREVTAIDTKNKEVLERTDGTGVINSIEIIATLDVYNQIKARAIDTDQKVGEDFIIVQVLGGNK